MAFGRGALMGRLLGFDPFTQLRTVRYILSPRGWPKAMQLRVLLLTDLHACEPWMNVPRIRHICAEANALKPDIILLLGDYVSTMRALAEPVPPVEWAAELARLEAPLGVHAILGNHDWREDEAAQVRGTGPTEAGQALEAAGIRVYENEAVPIKHGKHRFWLAGLGDQRAFPAPDGHDRSREIGVDDLPATLDQVSDDAPLLLMAHEPDIFPHVPDRVSLTVSGHTHGGQIRLFGHAPVVPSAYGERYAYGHIHEGGRDLIVSGGLGCTRLPIRFAMPPELTLVELGGVDEGG